jgi:hypothetical protein
MKLYTEEQVFQIIERSQLNQHLTYGEVLDGIASIEIPSDEEISEESMDLFWGDSNSLNHILQYKAFKRGAKWMRDKIQGGNQ